MNGIMHL